MTLVLVDTSIWVQHFRALIPELVAMLQRGEVVTHSVVVDELAVGNLRQRPQTLADLTALGQVAGASTRVTLDLIERERLFGIGLSWGNVQLLASSEPNRVRLWTLDRRLYNAAISLSLAYP